MKIALLLSGGVDSSVALFRLLEEGYTNITPYYLKIWLEDEMSYMGSCPWEEDLSYATQVCEQGGLELKIINLQKEYYEKVVQYAVEELREGRTPSPDIFCNQRVKFGAFFEKVQEKYDKVATGHYGKTMDKDGLTHLFRSPDPVKDQSYFLSYLSQEQLKKIWFPIGHLEKNQVRELAQKYNLVNKDRKDSQGICFLGKIKYRDFVGHYLGKMEGEIREKESGKVLGTHQGYWFHTIGQRQGLGLSNGPWYVVDKDLSRNIIYVSHKEHQENQDNWEFLATKLTWTLGEPPDFSQGSWAVKLRHGPRIIPARIKLKGKDQLQITLQESDKGIAPGQFSVLYLEEECFGAGMITQVIR